MTESPVGTDDGCLTAQSSLRDLPALPHEQPAIKGLSI